MVSRGEMLPSKQGDQGDALDWARDGWCTLHYVMANRVWDSEEQRQAFIQAYGQTLLCAPCRYHFLKMVNQDYPPPDGQASLSNLDQQLLWSVDCHNRVNNRLKKPEFSQNQARGTYCVDSTFPRPFPPGYVWRYLHRLAANSDPSTLSADWTPENIQACEYLLGRLDQWLPRCHGQLLQTWMNMHRDLPQGTASSQPSWREILFHLHNRANIEQGKPAAPASVLDAYRLGGCGVNTSKEAADEQPDLGKKGSKGKACGASGTCTHKYLILITIIIVLVVLLGLAAYLAVNYTRK